MTSKGGATHSKLLCVSSIRYRRQRPAMSNNFNSLYSYKKLGLSYLAPHNWDVCFVKLLLEGLTRRRIASRIAASSLDCPRQRQPTQHSAQS